MTKIAILLGSTRPGRNGEAVAKWVAQLAAKRTDAEFELIDIAEQDLPLLDEPIPPSQGKYTKEHTKAWSAKISGYDGFVFVTPEYNHGVPAAMKNAIDFLYKEWNNKAAGFVAYGSAGGTRVVEHWRGICSELQMATVRAQVMLSLRDDFVEYRTFKPQPQHEGMLNTLLDQLVAWSTAFKQMREAKSSTHGESRDDRGNRAARPTTSAAHPAPQTSS
jgi:NAD(P)H-dependent FMN reductase